VIAGEQRDALLQLRSKFHVEGEADKGLIADAIKRASVVAQRINEFKDDFGKTGWDPRAACDEWLVPIRNSHWTS